MTLPRCALGALLLIPILWIAPSWAEHPNLREWAVRHDFDSTYRALYQALEADRFYVVFEPDIQRNLASFAERWGTDYNRSRLQEIRAMVFCNAWYANQVANHDPAMTAVCPLHLTLIHRDGITHVLFIRPSRIGVGSPAEPILAELETAVISAIEQALQSLAGAGQQNPP